MAATGHLSLATARRPSLALIALCANLAVTLPLAYILNIWQDEAFTLQTTGHGFAYAFHQALAFEQNAPLYFVFLSALRHLGSSIFFLRLPSVLCIALAVVLVPELARRYIPAIDAGLVTLVAAWNPFMIWAAVEMRVYALIIALSALLLLTFFDAFLAREPSKTSAVAYAVCCILALYTQYYLGFLIAAQALTLVLIQRRAIGRFALCAGAGVLAFAPMLAIVPAQVENFKSAFTPPTFPRAVEVLAAILARYVLPLTFHHATLAYLVLGAGAIGVAIAARKSFTALGDVTILLITAWTFAFFAVASYATGVHVLDRHAACLYLPCTLSVFAIFTFLRRPLQERAALGWSCLALLASTVALVHTYAPLAKPGDWIRATAYLRAHEHPQEPIVVFEAENALPLAYYYHGPNRIVAIPQGVDFRRYDVTRFVLHQASEAEAAIPAAQRIWLVTAGECASANIQFGCGVLERYVAQHYRTVSSASFYGSRIRLLQLTSSARRPSSQEL
ncbi:MAG: glycosyltransferase family 39 protein [Candidatus Cybelea sp.]